MVEHKCDYNGCEFKSDRVDNLNRHKRIKHSNPPKISCDKCSELLTVDALRRHKKTTKCKNNRNHQNPIEMSTPANTVSVKNVRPITSKIIEHDDSSTTIKHDQNHQNSIENSTPANIVSVKNVSIPLITVKIIENDDGSTSIRHDQIIIEGTPFLLVPAFVAHDICSTEVSNIDTPNSPLETSDDFQKQTLYGENE